VDRLTVYVPYEKAGLHIPEQVKNYLQYLVVAVSVNL